MVCLLVYNEMFDAYLSAALYTDFTDNTDFFVIFERFRVIRRWRENKKSETVWSRSSHTGK
ncbi:MAG: hypothetical protein DCC59_14150 [Chloroflexi bacterium]|nr:hypothetical protein [Chloroflexi bacterium CFX1]MCQ3952537.1 hypothetical protein [Chloroflexota bacterium]RIK49746.1 MAG: hypothetical protein DCC59_14150 [Chloroflexota bacterium]